MAYYKVRIEVWCDWNPAESALDDIAQMLPPRLRPVQELRSASIIFTVAHTWSPELGRAIFLAPERSRSLFRRGNR
jgi:hypothetical protein